MQRGHPRGTLCLGGEGGQGVLRPRSLLSVADIAIIDAHSQVPHRCKELEDVIRLMDQGFLAYVNSHVRRGTR